MMALLRVEGLKKYFRASISLLSRGKGDGRVKAVDGVSFTISPGEWFGIAGESGCGKSTLGKIIAGLLDFSEGCVEFEGVSYSELRGDKKKWLHRNVQMIFQDPYSSLNPRRQIRGTLERPYRAQGVHYTDADLKNLLELVGLVPADEFLRKYPSQLSGGQRQRVAIARAIALRPKLLVADEPLSALDVTVRAQILDLLQRLKRQFGLTYIFISHDLPVMRNFCDRIAVMYVGKIVELGPTDEIFENPMHPYTRALISSTPLPDPDAMRTREAPSLSGEVPSPLNPPSGCRFHPRCGLAVRECSLNIPDLIEVSPGHLVACPVTAKGGWS
jgi:oligopeptide/dipeptide ABC transporter ATP-binding protein